MLKINKHIEIVRSTRPGLNIMSQEAAEAIHAVLVEFYEKVGLTIVDDITDLERLVQEKPDLVFLGLKYLPMNENLGKDDPNKIWVSEYLDARDINYTGSSQKAIELELNKPMAKQHVMDAGLQTLNFFTTSVNRHGTEEQLPLSFPVFIKPTNMGGGQGIDEASVARNFAEFQAKVRSIDDAYHSDALVEEFLPGREFSVAILDDQRSTQLVALPIELVAAKNNNGDRILSQAVKSSNTEQVSVVEDEAMKQKVIKLALDIFVALGARDYGRIDIRLDNQAEPQFLEANLIPSLTSGYGSFPKACLLNKGMSYKTIILSIVRTALTRNPVTELPALHAMQPVLT